MAWERTSKLHSARKTFSSKLPSSTLSSAGGKPGEAFEGGGALSRHRKFCVRVGDSKLDLGGDIDFVGVSGTAGASSESREKYGGAEV